jgi:hypothetical protein
MNALEIDVHEGDDKLMALIAVCEGAGDFDDGEGTE